MRIATRTGRSLLCAALLFSVSSPVRARTIQQPRIRPPNGQQLLDPIASLDRGDDPPKTTASKILTVKRRLAALGYWTGPLNDEAGEEMRYAILAFQRAIGDKPTGRLTPRVIRELDRARKLKPSITDIAHIEISLSKQLLFSVDSQGQIRDILPVTTGTGKWFTADGWRRRAITPKGTFTVYRKIEGWHQSPFGDMFYSSYIVGGVAIHGSRFITNYRRTYGCIAVPLFAAERLSELMPIGTLVIVHN